MTKRIVFMGTPDFSVPILKALINSEYEVIAVVTQPDRPKGRKKILTAPPVKEEALANNIPVLQPEKIRHDYEQVLAYEPDLIVTAAYGQILPKEILTHPPFGCINVHASLLPELRGGAPIHYAIMEGKDETGVTIMYMVEALDAGDMIEQKAIPIEENDHVGTLHDKLSKLGAQLLMDVLPKLFANDIVPTPQDDALATYAYNIKREQEKIDWNHTQQTIYNHIRGLHPWPVAYTTYQNKNVKIWWADKNIDTTEEQPGTIVAIQEDGLIVATGDLKTIKITDLQIAGKKRMTVEQFLLGSNDYFKVGEQLG
ncbi:methionyl-tRNA formyltransferase [Bacillaceae bacterium W0354]